MQFIHVIKLLDFPGECHSTWTSLVDDNHRTVYGVLEYWSVEERRSYMEFYIFDFPSAPVLS